MEKTIKTYIKLLEKYSGKKVFLKEADEATKNQAVNSLQFISNSLSNCINKADELHELPILNKERNIKINQLSHILGKAAEIIDFLVEDITGARSNEQQGPVLDEDVAMSTDEIIKNPATVKKLSDKKIDIKVKDKNMKGISSSTTF